MLSISEKFMNESSRAGSKPVGVVGFVKTTLAIEAYLASHWNAALASSNIAVIGNEVWLAKTLATGGVSQAAANTNRQLQLGLVWMRGIHGGSSGGYVWSDKMRNYYQSFKVPTLGYLNTITVDFTRIIGANPSTVHIAICDTNETSPIEAIAFLSDTIYPICSVPVRTGSGNGTISQPVLSQSTISETFNVTCITPGGTGTGQFSVVGSVSGNIGTATSGVQFVDGASKLKFTITAVNPWTVGDKFTFTTTAGPRTTITADFSAVRPILLDPSTTYKIAVSQSTVPQDGSGDLVSIFANNGNPYAAGDLRYAIDSGPSTVVETGVDMTFQVTMQNRYQPTGSISVKLDLGQVSSDPGEWAISDVQDGDSSISYHAWSSATGLFAGEETDLGTISDRAPITDLKRYYKVTATLTASSDNLTSPHIIKIKANFDQWDQYTLKDSFLEDKGNLFPPIVVSIPQLQYQMDVLEGKSSISKVSIDFLDDGFLEETLVNPNFYLKNNEIIIKIGFDADGWTFSDYMEFWRGNIVSWKRRPGIITLECADWAVLSKFDIPVEDPTTGAITPIVYDNSTPTTVHPEDIKLDILKNKINLRDGQIHSGSFGDAKTALPGWKFQRTISTPTDAWKLIQEINQYEGAVLIPREDGKLYSYLFNPAATTVAEFGDNEIKIKSAAFDSRMDQTLFNEAIVYYGFHAPLSLTGTATWTSNSPTVTGSGTHFLQELTIGMEIQGPDGRLYRVQSIASDTSMALESSYGGVNATGAVKRPRTSDESKPSAYQGAVVVSDAASITNYKQTLIKRILPSPWLGTDDATYNGKDRATDVATRLKNLSKDGIPYCTVTTSLEFLHLQVGDFIRLGSRTTLPRNLLGFTWTKWVLVSKTIDFKSKQIQWGMMKVPSGVPLSEELKVYSDWLNAATNVINLVISQWPTEVILQFSDSERSAKLDTHAEWSGYDSISNVQIL